MGIKGILKTTKWHRRFWKNRKIDWGKSYFNPDHPHRQLIIDRLKEFKDFKSILEVGCAAGANLYKIKQNFPWCDVGGIDWSVEAIEEAKKMLPRITILQVGEADDIYISEKGADMVISDMCFIYLTKKNFRKALQEAKRVARIGVIFCEFNRKKWYERVIIRLLTGYNTYDYEKELISLGFHDVKIEPVSVKDWPDTEKEKGLRCIISART